MIRSFLAIVPPFAVQEAIHRYIETCESALPQVRWVKPENLHFTLRFFGDLDHGARGTAVTVADRVASQVVVFPVELGGIGVFPKWSQPRVLWWGVTRGEDRLMALAQVLNRNLEAVGLGQADKPFKAHLTMGRWKERVRIEDEPRNRICAEAPPVGFSATSLRLMGSSLGPQGPHYEVLHEALFKKPD